jgi:glutaminyl-tRNA synthetase
MKMRDPLLYRIRHASHHRTGDAWCIYPMYDYAHPLEDAIEGITHSICTLEFENNRELYDWVIEHAWARQPSPRQYEFARLNLDYTVMSKRKLLQLVEGGHVAGWDDPRMPTIAGMRRRGYSPEAIRTFCDMVGVAKNNSVVDLGKLEFCVRDDLNRNAPRVLAVLRPLDVELVDWDGDDEMIDAPYFPPDVGKPGSRPIAIGSRLVIDRDDWRDDPPAGYQRLAPGRTIRLRYAYCITCEDVERDADGTAIRLRCRVHRETLGGKNPADGRKVSGVIHWVSATRSLPAEVRLYDRLFAHPRPDEGGGDFLEHLDRGSLVVVKDARVEDSLGSAAVGSRWQFERTGYFIVDTDSRGDRLMFNRIVGLRDREKTKADEPAATGTKKADNVKAATRPKTRSPQEWRAEARARDPELAAAYRRAHDDLGLPADHADLVSGDLATARLFVGAATASNNAAAVARWIINELPRALGGAELADGAVPPAHFAALVDMVERGAISTPAGKDVLAEMVKTGGDPAAIVSARGLGAIADEGELAKLVDDVMVRNPDKVEQYRGGKTGLHGFFVGQVVKASGGKANPTLVAKLVTERLGG